MKTAVVKILSILLIRLNFSLHSQSYAEHSMPFCSPLLLAFKGCAALAKGVHWPIGVQQHLLQLERKEENRSGISSSAGLGHTAHKGEVRISYWHSSREEQN